MPLYNLNDEYLDSLCWYLCNTNYIYYPVHKDFHQDLYFTGCRPIEVMESYRWEIQTDGTLRLQPAKENNYRYFPRYAISDSLFFAIENQMKPYQGLSLRQLTDVTKKIIPVWPLHTAVKRTINYPFRYNFQKKLHNSGNTDNQIRSIMGYDPDTQPSVYYGQTIYANSSLPNIPQIMKSVFQLASFPTVAINSSTATQTVNPFTVPANTFTQTGDRIQINLTAELTAATANQQVLLSIDSIDLLLFQNTTNATYKATIIIEMIRKTASVLAITTTAIVSNANTVIDRTEVTGMNFTIAIVTGIKLTADGTNYMRVDQQSITFFPEQ